MLDKKAVAPLAACTVHEDQEIERLRRPPDSIASSKADEFQSASAGRKSVVHTRWCDAHRRDAGDHKMIKVIASAHEHGGPVGNAFPLARHLDLLAPGYRETAAVSGRLRP